MTLSRSDDWSMRERGRRFRLARRSSLWFYAASFGNGGLLRRRREIAVSGIEIVRPPPPAQADQAKDDTFWISAMRSGRQVMVVAAAVFAVGLAVVACGGSSSNGEADKSAQQIFKDAQAATGAASSAQVSGTVTSNGTTVQLDVVAGQGSGGGRSTRAERRSRSSSTTRTSTSKPTPPPGPNCPTPPQPSS